jgi:hypothetical protein
MPKNPHDFKYSRSTSECDWFECTKCGKCVPYCDLVNYKTVECDG